MVVTNNKEILLIFEVEFTEGVLDILLNPGCTMDPQWLDPGKILLIKDLRRVKNAIFRLVFAYTVFHKRAILLIW